MDYAAFYKDVLGWIQQVNQTAVKHSMDSDKFWTDVVDSASAICNKYGNHRLALMQMTMMVEWLDDVYKQRQQGGKSA